MARKLAAVLIASGSVLFSITGLFAKLASDQVEISTFSLLAIRSFLGLVCGLISFVARALSGSIASRSMRKGASTAELAAADDIAESKPTDKLTLRRWILARMSLGLTRIECGWLALRCLSGFSAGLLEYAALRVLPLGLNTLIYYSSPAFISVWALVLFREPVRVRVVLCLALCFTGLLLIVRPWTFRENMPRWACILVLVAAVLTALVYIALRELKQVPCQVVLNVYLSTSLFYSVVAGVSLGLMPMPPLDSPAWLPLLGVGVSAYAAEVCITRGAACAGPHLGEITVLKFLSPICSMLWGLMFLNEYLKVLDVVGGALVIGPAALILRFSMVGPSRPSENESLDECPPPQELPSNSQGTELEAPCP